MDTGTGAECGCTLHIGGGSPFSERRRGNRGLHRLCSIWQAEFAEKYLRQGTKIAITGRIQTGSYTNREGRKVYTTDVVVEEQEFAESKNAEHPREQGAAPQADMDGFMTIPDGVDEDIPFM